VEVLGVGEKSKVAFTEERGDDTCNEQQQQKGRVPDEYGGECHGGNGLLDEPAHLLNHGEPVSGLNARAFETIVKDGIFVRR
jgi:hypothetical protein